ncbi:MAG: leucyl aminopeptidase [Propionibacteriaceae bacterium]
MPAFALPTLRHAASLPGETDVLAVGWTGTDVVGLPAETAKVYAKVLKTTLAQTATSLSAGADLGTTTLLPAVAAAPIILLVGLGEPTPEGTTPDDLRYAAGSLARAVRDYAGERAVRLAVSLGSEEPAALRATAEGLLLGSYAYRQASQPAPGAVNATLLTGTSGAATELSAAQAVAEAVSTAREWINLPPNLLYPASFADQARELARGSKVKVEVLDDTQLAAGGYGGLLAVGGGSSRPPRLVRMSYAPRGAKTHLALVGKGITFDSGGLNIKPGDSMYTMKCDMSGAAVVLAAISAVAQLGLKVKVTAYGALAENLPSGTAFRPSDVLSIYGGTTVENGNSDAEGRLVLADGIVRAGEDKPDLIVDVATLTGACVTALGERTAGLMANDDNTAERVLAAAATAGEPLWRLPIPPEFRGKIESKVADLKSTGEGRAGGALIAAAFLREFVADGIAWAHLDIAGPAFHTGAPYGYTTAGGTGYGVRTLVQLARMLAG